MSALADRGIIASPAPFEEGKNNSSALSGISSMRGDFSFGSSTEELAAVGLTEGLIPLSAYADIPLFKGDMVSDNLPPLKREVDAP